jgi:phosphoribosylamine--glycine ligase
MKILVIGSGAREHALCWKLGAEPAVSDVICAPGNAGLARSTPTAAVDAADPSAVLELARAQQVDLTVIGPEAPLAAGVVDRFRAAGQKIFGPTQAAARLETSKAFAKDFMRRHGVPTARFRTCASADEALGVVRSGEFGGEMVVKADGLAAGKGVVVAPDRAAAEAAVAAAMLDRAFGDAGARVVIEERLDGAEVSFFVVADGDRYVPLVSAQDHKRIFDGDRGPNTGGMGAFAPSPLVTLELQARIEREIVRPVLGGMASEGTPFCGFLYCGLMITAEGPKVIEFNVRFGDPEAQVVLPLLEEPLAPLLMAAAHGALPGLPAEASAKPGPPSPGAIQPSYGEVSPKRPPAAKAEVGRTIATRAVGIVLATAGYPGETRLGDAIRGLDALSRERPDALAFFGGVKARDASLITAGGRVMTIVARGTTYQRAMADAYDAASRVHFDGMQFRRDVGHKAIHP